MKMSVSASPASSEPSLAAALSSARQLVVPTAHTAFFDARLHRLERPGADVEHQLGALHSLRFDRRQELRGEVQASRRRRDRAALARIDRLVALRVHRLVAAVHVRRERDVAEPLDRFVARERPTLQPDDARSPLRGLEYLGVESVGDVHPSPRPELPPGMDHRLPAVAA
jgi:hypothetical protein